MQQDRGMWQCSRQVVESKPLLDQEFACLSAATASRPNGPALQRQPYRHTETRLPPSGPVSSEPLDDDRALLALRAGSTHIWHFFLVWVLKDIPQDINLGAWLDSNTSLHAFVVDELDQLLGRCFLVRACRGFFGSSGRYSSFVVEAVQIAPCLLELTDPFLRLCNHHMTIKCPLSVCGSRAVDVATDLGDNRCTECHVRHEVAVHDVDLGISVASHIDEESF